MMAQSSREFFIIRLSLELLALHEKKVNFPSKRVDKWNFSPIEYIDMRRLSLWKKHQVRLTNDLAEVTMIFFARKFGFLFRYTCFGVAFMFVSILSAFSVEIYLSELDLFLSTTTLMIGNLLFTLFWVLCCSYRKDVEQNDWCIGLYYLVPTLIILFLIFAQYHFYIAAAIIALIAVAKIVLNPYVICIILNLDFKTTRRTVLTRACRRLMVFLFGFTLTIPCLMSTLIYKLEKPTYTAQYAVLDQLLDHNRKSCYDHQKLIEESADVLLSMQKENWAPASESKKLELLQTIADIEACCLGIPRAQVSCRGNSFTSLGQYNYSTNSIEVNQSVLSNRTAEENITIICHEIFHAYQRFVCDALDWQTIPSDCEYFALAKSWQNNFESYSPGNSMAYYCQPVEVSARQYAEATVSLYLDSIDVAWSSVTPG